VKRRRPQRQAGPAAGAGSQPRNPGLLQRFDRVADRGPYRIPDRCDLAKGAARDLSFHHAPRASIGGDSRAPDDYSIVQAKAVSVVVVSYPPIPLCGVTAPKADLTSCHRMPLAQHDDPGKDKYDSYIYHAENGEPDRPGLPLMGFRLHPGNRSNYHAMRL